MITMGYGTMQEPEGSFFMSIYESDDSHLQGRLLYYRRSTMKLSAKERRLKDYLEKCKRKGIQPTVGDVCRDLRTTPLTLLGKTLPSLKAKGLL